MQDRYLYLLLNIGTIAIPFLASFYSKANFSKTWKSFFQATSLVAIVFIVWDIYFTKIGIWGFNPKYLIGIHWFGIPLEEIMFFITIPYACTFTYFAIKHLIPGAPTNRQVKIISYIIIVVALISMVEFHDRLYTLTTTLLLVVLMVVLVKLGFTNFLGHFYLTYILILIPFIIVNGILTGTGIENEVVWYNNMENMSIRIGTIPLDDFFYCLLLLLSNISLYEYFNKNRNISSASSE